MSVKVELASDDPALLLRMVRHHAQPLIPLVLELLGAICLRLGADPREWTIRQSRGGANSFSLRNHTQEYHFRSDQRVIIVKDRALRGVQVARIETRADARRFVDSIS